MDKFVVDLDAVLDEFERKESELTSSYFTYKPVESNASISDSTPVRKICKPQFFRKIIVQQSCKQEDCDSNQDAHECEIDRAQSVDALSSHLESDYPVRTSIPFSFSGTISSGYNSLRNSEELLSHANEHYFGTMPLASSEPLIEEATPTGNETARTFVEALTPTVDGLSDNSVLGAIRPSNFKLSTASSLSVSTPQCDFGWSRVPGMNATEPILPESTNFPPPSLLRVLSHETDAASFSSTSCSSSGVDRICSAPRKRLRPNSLLGLSTPTLPSEIYKQQHQRVDRVSGTTKSYVKNDFANTSFYTNRQSDPIIQSFRETDILPSEDVTLSCINLHLTSRTENIALLRSQNQLTDNLNFSTMSCEIETLIDNDQTKSVNYVESDSLTNKDPIISANHLNCEARLSENVTPSSQDHVITAFRSNESVSSTNQDQTTNSVSRLNENFSLINQEQKLNGNDLNLASCSNAKISLTSQEQTKVKNDLDSASHENVCLTNQEQTKVKNDLDSASGSNENASLTNQEQTKDTNHWDSASGPNENVSLTYQDQTQDANYLDSASRLQYNASLTDQDDTMASSWSNENFSLTDQEQIMTASRSNENPYLTNQDTNHWDSASGSNENVSLTYPDQKQDADYLDSASGSNEKVSLTHQDQTQDADFLDSASRLQHNASLTDQDHKMTASRSNENVFLNNQEQTIILNYSNDSSMSHSNLTLTNHDETKRTKSLNLTSPLNENKVFSTQDQTRASLNLLNEDNTTCNGPPRRPSSLPLTRRKDFKTLSSDGSVGQTMSLFLPSIEVADDQTVASQQFSSLNRTYAEEVANHPPPTCSQNGVECGHLVDTQGLLFPISSLESSELQRMATEEAAAEVDQLIIATSAEALFNPPASNISNPSPHLLTPLAETPQSAASSEDSAPPLLQGIAPTINPSVNELGRVPPVWVADREAPLCAACTIRFTMMRRRHHCRACGRVFCAACCSYRAKIPFLQDAKARVCHVCFQHMLRLESSTLRGTYLSSAANAPSSALRSVNSSGASDPTRQRRPSKTVTFSDGLRPGVLIRTDDANDLSDAEDAQIAVASTAAASGSRFCMREGDFPLVLADDGRLQEEDVLNLMVKFQVTTQDSCVWFALAPRLLIQVCRRDLECCAAGLVWCFATKGLRHLGQEELLFVIQCEADEPLPPLDLFDHLRQLAERVARGEWIRELDHSFAAKSGFLGSHENAGFIFIRPTFQCVRDLPLPKPSGLVGVLIQRWEAPWAKLFPLRLALRLGAAQRLYPAPLVSVRQRAPVFGEIGNSVLALLADFRTYSYSVPRVPGMAVLLSKGRTEVRLPRLAYAALQRALAAMDSQVLALAADFSTAADSHLVCVQNDEGEYSTQAISMAQRSRQLTGASFLVLNGGQRHCRSSLVEDSLMVQLTAEQLAAVLSALKSMQAICIPCVSNDADDSSNASRKVDQLEFVWTDDALPGPPVEPSLFNVHHDQPELNYAGETLRAALSSDASSQALVRLRNIRLLCDPPNAEYQRQPVDAARLARDLAKATLSVLELRASSLLKLSVGHVALRVCLDPEQVGYETAAAPDFADLVRLMGDEDLSSALRSYSQALPDECIAALDEALVPVVHHLASFITGGPVVLELNFSLMAFL